MSNMTVECDIPDGSMQFNPIDNGSENPIEAVPLGADFSQSMMPPPDMTHDQFNDLKHQDRERRRAEKKARKEAKKSKRSKHGEEDDSRRSKRHRDGSSSSDEGRAKKPKRHDDNNNNSMVNPYQIQNGMADGNMMQHQPMHSQADPRQMHPVSALALQEVGKMARPIDMSQIMNMQQPMDGSAMPFNVFAMPGKGKGRGKGNRGQGQGQQRQGGQGQDQGQGGPVNHAARAELNAQNNDPNFPDSFANRRARELYIGGLISGQANRANIKDFFAGLLAQLTRFQTRYAKHPQYQGAVKEITISDGSFAFVEFWTEELAATVIEFDGVQFQGRNLKIGRPAKFVPSGPLADPMDVTELRESGMIPSERSQHANTPGYGGKNTPLTKELRQKAKFDRQGSTNEFGMTPQGKGKGKGKGKGGNQYAIADDGGDASGGKGSGRKGGKSSQQRDQTKMSHYQMQEKKARELYCGNLQAGLCNHQSLRELFSPACEMLPEYNSEMGPAIMCVDVRGGGTFAFVEFQNEKMASAALAIFDKMEVGGRQINVGRPAGYNGPTPNADQNFGLPRPDSDLGMGNRTPQSSMNSAPGFNRSFSGVFPDGSMAGTPHSHHGGLQHQNSNGSMFDMSGMNPMNPVMPMMDPMGQHMIDPNTGMMMDPSMNGGFGMDQFGMSMDNGMGMNPANTPHGMDPMGQMSFMGDPNHMGSMAALPMDPSMHQMGGDPNMPPMDPHMQNPAMTPPMPHDPSMTPHGHQQFEQHFDGGFPAMTPPPLSMGVGGMDMSGQMGMGGMDPNQMHQMDPHMMGGQQHMGLQQPQDGSDGLGFTPQP